MNPTPLAPTPPVPPQSKAAKKNAFWWLPLLAISLAFAFTVYTLFWPEYQRDQLVKRGIPATAVILNADPTGSTYNSQPEVRLKLRITPQNGLPYDAETVMIINPIYAPQFQPGKNVKVRYDRADKMKVAVEETENGQR